MKHRKKRPGLPPGSIIFTGRKKVEKPFIHAVAYNAEALENNQLDPNQPIIIPKSEPHKIRWIDLRGLHDTDLILKIGSHFSLHHLIQEDIANIHQRPKIEEYENGLFFIIKAIAFQPQSLKFKMEQVAIFMGADFVLSFQEDQTDLFGHVRERLENPDSKIRKSGTDYLTYALFDVIIDHYFEIIDEVEDSIERTELEIQSNPSNSSKEKIYQLKQEIIRLRKSISPLREAISKFYRLESPFLGESTKVYLRDLYDHTINVMDIIDSFRDILTGLQDLYLSEISFRMNKVMQLLTVISTIFIPLSFLVGLYGMNFDNMPELHWKYSYFVLLAVMFSIFLGSLIYFVRKKWL